MRTAVTANTTDGTVMLETALADERAAPMARKPNYEFERRERARLKALKNAEKAAMKKEARERARSQSADTGAPEGGEPEEKT